MCDGVQLLSEPCAVLTNGLEQLRLRQAIEDMRGNEVYGRITPVLGVYDANAGPAPEGAFPKLIRLVQ